MSKAYKGYELIKAISDKEIDYNQKFDVLNKEGCLWIKNATINNIKTLDLLEFNFELIEDNNIDIDSIKSLLEIEPYEADKTDTVINRNKVNELIQAVKQLNREIKELKEKTNAK